MFGKIKPWEDLHGLQRNRMGQILGITNLDRLFPGGGILQLEGICYVVMLGSCIYLPLKNLIGKPDARFFNSKFTS